MNHLVHEAGTDAAATVSTNDSQEKLLPAPPYLRMVADCWHQIFDSLSLNDVFQMGETCKQLHEMVGYYMCKYFPELRYELIAGEVHFKQLQTSFHLRTNFCQFIPQLYIGKSSELNYFLDSDTLCSLKTLIFDSIELTETHIQYARNILKNIENLHLKYCNIDGRAYEQLIAYCPKLRFLNIYDCYLNVSRQLIFSQNSPSLEHFQYESGLWHQGTFDQLQTFLENHPHLKYFESECGFLWEHQDILLQSNVQLERLIIQVYQWNTTITFQQYGEFLTALHASGFYKALHMSFQNGGAGYRDLFSHISTLPLEMLTGVYTSNIDWDHLIAIKQLHLWMMHNANIEVAAKKLTQLEHLTINDAKTHHILAFISHSSNLKTIKIQANFHKSLTLDLFAMNEERKKLKNARKIAICLPERLYLSKKQELKVLNLSHIKLARFDM